MTQDEVQFPAVVNFVTSPSKIYRTEIFGNEDQSKLHVHRRYKLIKISCVRNRFQAEKYRIKSIAI
jgi:hypothetical protein